MTSIDESLSSVATPRRWFLSLREQLGRVPLALILLGMRITVGSVFFKAGLLKYNSFEFAIKLFEEEYKVPVLAPAIAARLAMMNEMTWPIFLFLGLATRFATLPLLVMVSVIQLFVYPQAWTENIMWASILLMLLTRGAGAWSIDHLIERWFAARAHGTRLQ